MIAFLYILHHPVGFKLLLLSPPSSSLGLGRVKRVLKMSHLRLINTPSCWLAFIVPEGAYGLLGETKQQWAYPCLTLYATILICQAKRAYSCNNGKTVMEVPTAF